MIVFFRVDSGEAIGSGHIVRCLTLADRLQSKYDNIECIFLSKPHHKNIISVIKNRGFSVIELSAPEFIGSSDEATWLGTSQEQDAQELINIFDSVYHNVNKILIIDHYSLDHIWEKLLRPYVKEIIVIDDLANRHHDCDILLDQNFYLDKDIRYNGLVPKHTQLLLGPEYALLRPEFYDYQGQYQFSDQINNMFVYFGGIDAVGMTLKTVKILKDYPDITTHIIVSKNCADYQTIQKIAQNYPYLKCYDHCDNMAKMMVSCDAAIGAGGTTQWERACIGIPSLVFAIADNQKKICQDMARSGFYLYGGSVKDILDIDFKILVHFLVQNNFLRESFLRKSMTIQTCPSIENRISLNKRHLSIREVIKEDCINIFNWRNDIKNRVFSAKSQEFLFENHEKWFNTVLHDDKKNLYIIFDQENPVGVVRFDENLDHILVSIYLVPDCHGQGYGKDVLKTAEDFFKTSKNNVKKPFFAEILFENKASIKMFENLGYKLVKKYYIKENI